MKYYLFIFIVYSSFILLEFSLIDDKLDRYFNEARTKKLKATWEAHRKAFEDAVQSSIKETYGAIAGSMNIYVKRQTDPHELCPGFLMTDNVVHVLMMNMYLREMPQLIAPDVTLPLQDNVLTIETPLTKIFIDGDYLLYRNTSDIIFEGQQDSQKESPFALQQVQIRGHLTIIGEDCHLVGNALVTLTGLYVHVGLNNFKVVNCKFTVEISQPDNPSPPVIAPYFSIDQCLQLETILSKPLSEEMWPKLQGSMISLINTTAIFGVQMYDYRNYQKKILTATAEFVTLVVRHLKKLIIKHNQGVVELTPIELHWDDTGFEGIKRMNKFSLDNVTMNGLDLIYSANRGGPINLQGHKIAEELRFELLQIRGNMNYERGVHSFVVEVKDVTVNILLSVKSDDAKDEDDKEEDDLVCFKKGEVPGAQRSRSEHLFHITGWRSIEFIYMGPDRTKRLLTGYLQTEIPKAINELLMQLFDEAVLKAEHEADGYKDESNVENENNGVTDSAEETDGVPRSKEKSVNDEGRRRRRRLCKDK